MNIKNHLHANFMPIPINQILTLNMSVQIPCHDSGSVTWYICCTYNNYARHKMAHLLHRVMLGMIVALLHGVG